MTRAHIQDLPDGAHVPDPRVQCCLYPGKRSCFAEVEQAYILGLAETIWHQVHGRLSPVPTSCQRSHGDGPCALCSIVFITARLFTMRGRKHTSRQQSCAHLVGQSSDVALVSEMNCRRWRWLYKRRARHHGKPLEGTTAVKRRRRRPALMRKQWREK